MNRLVKKRDTRCRFNEAKFKILSVLVEASKPKGKYLLPKQIAKLTGLSEGGVRVRLLRLSKSGFQEETESVKSSTEKKWPWRGYIWRKKCPWKGQKGFMYRYLKPKGVFVHKILEHRMKIREVTGVNISLNLHKPIPIEVLRQYERLNNVKRQIYQTDVSTNVNRNNQPKNSTKSL